MGRRSNAVLTSVPFYQHSEVHINFKATAKFDGLNISVAQATYGQAIQLSTEQSADIVLEEAEAIVPVDTGELRESGHTEVERAGLQSTAAVVFDSEHAGYVEFGTGQRGAESPGAGEGPYDPNWPGMPAQPYLRPALDTARPAITEVFRDNIAAANKLLGR